MQRKDLPPTHNYKKKKKKREISQDLNLVYAAHLDVMSNPQCLNFFRELILTVEFDPRFRTYPFLFFFYLSSASDSALSSQEFN